MKIAVTGATGYIGGRLVPRLIADGHEVVCLARNPAKLAGRSWTDQIEAVTADVLQPDSLQGALSGCDVAFYLVHSMGSADSFRDADKAAATNFARAAANAGVGRIVYLGGLGDEDDSLSHHLDSRHEVGRALASGTVPVTEVRAAVIIGSGSVSFEMLRYLTEVLPAMVTPSWVQTRCQPIAIRDVLLYLIACLNETDDGHTVYEIGGPEVLSYLEMMHEYAKVAGLPRRFVVPVPVLSPRLSSLWIGLVTPLPVGVARPLVDSLKNEVIVHGGTASVLGRSESKIPAFESPVMTAGEVGAHDRLERFLQTVDRYEEDRDRPDLDRTSHLAADLKVGTISARSAVERVGRSTSGRRAFVRQVAWRDFHAQVLFHSPRRIDHAYREEFDSIDWADDDAAAEGWGNGQKANCAPFAPRALIVVPHGSNRTASRLLCLHEVDGLGIQHTI